MLLWLLKHEEDLFLSVISYLDSKSLQNLTKTNEEIACFLYSASNRLWISNRYPSVKTFIIQTPKIPSAIVADEAVVGLALGPKIIFL